MLLLRSICIALSSTFLFAQNYSPVHFGNTEGPDNNVFPFGYTATPFRYSQIHDDVPLMVIVGMAFRHDFGPWGPPFPGYTVTMDAWISTAVTASPRSICSRAVTQSIRGSRSIISARHCARRRTRSSRCAAG